MRLIHLADADNRDSHVRFVSVSAAPPPTRAVGAKPVQFRRYLAATEQGTHDALQKTYGDDYGKVLIEGDPEVDMESVGRTIGATNTVYLSGSGEVLRVAPKILEVLFAPDGTERERRDPVETPSNIQNPTPVRWGKVKLKRKDAVRRLAFTRTVQLVHVDGLTCQYLHGLAKQLDEADEMVLIGAGPTGRDPLIFQTNGVPWRGFLEGRVNGPRYQLLLRLSNLELTALEAKA